jgi:hypothetical protein
MALQLVQSVCTGMCLSFQHSLQRQHSKSSPIHWWKFGYIIDTFPL